MTNPSLPDMPYLTEPGRAQIHPAIVRTISIPSIPPNFPFNAPITDERRNRGPRFVIGWLEFQSPEQPDPEVARPGDVWIQLPSGHRKARVYACYNTQGRDWSPWAGNSVELGGRGNTPMHPFLNDHAQRRFFLIFNGTEFTWANPKGVSIIVHTAPQIASFGPAEAVIKWLKETGVGRPSPTAIEPVVRSTSAPQESRKHARTDHSETPADTASAPPAKKPKLSQPETPPQELVAVKLGTYAKAGATQQGWVMSIDGMALHMPFPCINCARGKTPCSGIPGERCGRCRFKRLGCSHHTPKPRGHTRAPAVEAAKVAAESSVPAVATTTTTSPQSGLTFRLPPLRPLGSGGWADAAKPDDANKAPGQSSVRRVRIRSTSVVPSDNGDKNRSSSPLSSTHDPSDPVPPHSENAILDERDDAAVENLLDSASMVVSAVPAAAAAAAPVAETEAEVEVEAEAEAPSSVTAAEGSATDKTLPQDEAGGDEDEDEELARFMQITLDGMARAQEGLRGVFALTRKRLVVKRAAAAAQQVANVGKSVVAAAAAAGVESADARVPGAGHGPVSVAH